MPLPDLPTGLNLNTSNTHEIESIINLILHSYSKHYTKCFIVFRNKQDNSKYKCTNIQIKKHELITKIILDEDEDNCFIIFHRNNINFSYNISFAYGSNSFEIFISNY